MNVIIFPLRRGADGQLATVPADTDRHATQVALHALSCVVGERGLAPDYGLPDPTATDIDTALISAVLDTCEPDLAVGNVTVEQVGNQARIRADVTWAEDDPDPEPELREDVP